MTHPTHQRIDPLQSEAAAKPKPAKKKEGPKLLLAIGLLVVAAGVVAWSQGWLSAGTSSGDGLTIEERAVQDKGLEDAKKEAEVKAKTGATLPPAGS